MKTPQIPNPVPACQYCGKRSDWLYIVWVLFQIGLLLLGYMLIQYVSHDVESDCCRQVARYHEAQEQQYGLRTINASIFELTTK
jgi:hypothetical protein